MVTVQLILVTGDWSVWDVQYTDEMKSIFKNHIIYNIYYIIIIIICSLIESTVGYRPLTHFAKFIWVYYQPIMLLGDWLLHLILVCLSPCLAARSSTNLLFNSTVRFLTFAWHLMSMLGTWSIVLTWETIPLCATLILLRLYRKGTRGTCLGPLV